MRISLSRASSGAGTRSVGMTLVEMMVSMGIFTLVVLALVYTQMFVMRYDQLTNSKLGSSEMARMGFDQLLADVRGSWTWSIGTGDTNSFTAVPNGTLQSGNALQISPTQDTNSYVRYFFATNVTPNLTNYMLCRMTNGMTTSKVIATNLTVVVATNLFTAEDYLGNPLTTLRYKYVIHIVLDFWQYQYPLTRVGTGYYYDEYKLDFRVASHNL